MDKFIAIIQTGQAIQSALEKHGDFDDWFIKAMDIDNNLTKTYRVFESLEFPNKQNIAGIIITGSSAMVTDMHDWSEATISWLEQFDDSSVPILGVCYGHQLLAKLLGGKVDWNPKGRELGQVNMQTTNHTYPDELFKGSHITNDNNIKLLASHQQYVSTLPPKSVRLGHTKLDPNHCFRYKNHIWGLQFHPEFTPEITRDYIKARSQDIISEDLNPIQMIAEIEDVNNGSSILKNFKNICFK